MKVGSTLADTVTAVTTFDFDAGFPDKGVVYVACLATGQDATTDETIHIAVDVGASTVKPLFKGDGVYKVTKSALTGTFLFARV